MSSDIDRALTEIKRLAPALRATGGVVWGRPPPTFTLRHRPAPCQVAKRATAGWRR